MTPQEKAANDEYVRGVVARHTPSTAVVGQKMQDLVPHIHAWANGHQYQLKLSGSLAKGTGITGTTDADLFISLNPSVGTCNTLENVYTTLRNRFHGAGFMPREQNVSIGIDHTGLKVDLVAGVQHDVGGSDHSIWKRKAQTWTKTNIDKHIDHVIGSGRAFDIRAIKIWRKNRNLDFPSFYLELVVLEALHGRELDDPSGNFVNVMNYLVNDFTDKVIIDPANTKNRVSDDLTREEKTAIKNAVAATLTGTWEQAIK